MKIKYYFSSTAFYVILFNTCSFLGLCSVIQSIHIIIVNFVLKLSWKMFSLLCYFFVSVSEFHLNTPNR